MLESQIHPATVQAYNRMKNMVHERDKVLVAIQYPFRQVNSLKRILYPPRNTIFVDNRESFKRAVLEDGYYSYFIDNFFGSSGHYTAKGKELLAENIVNALKKYFHQQGNEEEDP